MGRRTLARNVSAGYVIIQGPGAAKTRLSSVPTGAAKRREKRRNAPSNVGFCQSGQFARFLTEGKRERRNLSLVSSAWCSHEASRHPFQEAHSIVCTPCLCLARRVSPPPSFWNLRSILTCGMNCVVLGSVPRSSCPWTSSLESKESIFAARVYHVLVHTPDTSCSQGNVECSLCRYGR